MTILELAERDLKKAMKSVKFTEEKKNVSEDELNHVKELLNLRETIYNIIKEKEES